MNDEQRILISILGATDALWTPNRDWTRPRPTNVWELRQQYLDVGVAWASGAVGNAAQKSASRTLDDLAARGAVVVMRRGGEVRFVRLSSATDDATRWLCYLPTTAESWLLLKRLAKRPVGAWTREIDFNRRRGWGDGHSSELAWVQNQLAPFLCRGDVVANATMQRHVCYAITTAGRASLKSGSPPAIAGDAKASDEAADFYERCWAEARSQLSTRKPTNPGEIGEIPLAMSACAPPAQRTKPKESAA